MSTEEIIKTNLKILIKEKDLTQPAFADLIGVPFTTVNSWLHGKSCPRYETLDKIAETCNLEPWQLLKNPLITEDHDKFKVLFDAVIILTAYTLNLEPSILRSKVTKLLNDKILDDIN